MQAREVDPGSGAGIDFIPRDERHFVTERRQFAHHVVGMHVVTAGAGPREPLFDKKPAHANQFPTPLRAERQRRIA